MHFSEKGNDEEEETDPDYSEEAWCPECALPLFEDRTELAIIFIPGCHHAYHKRCLEKCADTDG